MGPLPISILSSSDSSPNRVWLHSLQIHHYAHTESSLFGNYCINFFLTSIIIPARYFFLSERPSVLSVPASFRAILGLHRRDTALKLWTLNPSCLTPMSVLSSLLHLLLPRAVSWWSLNHHIKPSTKLYTQHKFNRHLLNLQTAHFANNGFH